MLDVGILFHMMCCQKVTKHTQNASAETEPWMSKFVEEEKTNWQKCF